MSWVLALTADRRATRRVRIMPTQVVVALGDARGLTGEHCTCRRLGIDGIGLAPSVARLAIGAVDLDDRASFVAQEPCQAGTIRARALDAEAELVPQAAGPGQKATVPGGCGLDLEVAQGPPEVAGEGRRDVHVTVGVDPDGDAVVLVCDPRQKPSSCPHVPGCLRG